MVNKKQDLIGLKNEIVQILGSFGEIYLPDDIKKEVDDLIGLETQKEYLDAFFKTLKSIKPEQDFFPIPIRMSALLIGPPGTGKTTLALALAKRYQIPILVVFSNSLIDSLLGETLQRIKRLLRSAENFARKGSPIIIFFDEIDAIASERANKNEVGEIKRTVISFLQELDLILEKELPIGIIGATNHPSQLDRAVWRRFTLKLEFPIPDKEIIRGILDYFINKINNSEKFMINVNSEGILDLFLNLSGADIERVFQIALFRAAQSPPSDNKYIITSDIIKHSLNFVIGELKNGVNSDLHSKDKDDFWSDYSE
ncbi:MAG: AAA family ATPase [Promethearchaeota archaeon]